MSTKSNKHSGLPVELRGDHLSPSEVATLRGVTRSCVYKWIHDGALPSVIDRYGRKFVRRADADAFVMPVTGYPKGRPRKIDAKKMKKALAMRAKGASYRKIGDAIGVSDVSVYQALNKENLK